MIFVRRADSDSWEIFTIGGALRSYGPFNTNKTPLALGLMAVDMTSRHHERENGRSFNSIFEVTISVDFSWLRCILFYIHLLHTIITYSEDMVEFSWNFSKIDLPMMLTAKLNRVLSFHPEHMFISTPPPLVKPSVPESRLTVVYQCCNMI